MPVAVVTERKCKDCGKPAAYAKHLWCRSCYAIYQQGQRLRHLEKRRAYDNARPRRPNPARDRDTGLRRRFGISQDDFERMLEAQQGVCAICGRTETKARQGVIMALAVDHCHTTLKVRGLLCNSCNLGIGKFDDDIARLQSAINYLNGVRP